MTTSNSTPLPFPLLNLSDGDLPTFATLIIDHYYYCMNSALNQIDLWRVFAGTSHSRVEQEELLADW
jgi:hypothetical protein